MTLAPTKRPRSFSGDRYHKGDRYGQLEIIGEPFLAWEGPQRKLMAVVRCDCGKTKVTRCARLKSGATSCGCLKQVNANKVARKHGMEGTPLYRVWRSMLNRCRNPRVKCWHRYGGRGISVCDKWRESFEAFRDWALVSGYAPGLEIDRRDNNGNYEPANCRWVTTKVNSRNRSNNTIATAFGETKLLIEWSEDPRCVVPYALLVRRVTRGWPVEIALGRPIQAKRKEVSN